MKVVTTWTVELSTTPAAESACDVLVVGVIAHDDGVVIADDSLLQPHLDTLHGWMASLHVSADVDEAKRLPAPEGMAAKSVVLVGLDSPTPSPDGLRHAAGVALRAAGKSGDVAVSLPGASPDHMRAIIEGALLGAHSNSRSDGSTPAETLRFLSVRGSLDAADVSRAVASAEAVIWVRERVTEPPNSLYPETFVGHVISLLAGLPVSHEVWDENALATGGFGGILGVGGGSSRPPRLMALRYQPENASGHIALVGKGITFDSGGLSLKPANSMVGMKYDMTGAATVAGVVMAAARLGAPVAVTGWLCLAEIMPSGSALRPNDVITIRGGKTVEVLNTDAEGRLVLADGLQRASEDNPDLIVDIATLTGAARVALGERFAGIMGDSAALDIIQDAATQAGELVWPMPLARELRTLLDSDVADIANAKPGNSLGGMLLAGLFLEEFVGSRPEGDTSGRIPWAHLDIAGPASNSSGAWGYTPKGATGAITRTLLSMLLDGPRHVEALAKQ
jgi:leucyl aminopeptidase